MKTIEISLKTAFWCVQCLRVYLSHKPVGKEPFIEALKELEKKVDKAKVGTDFEQSFG